MIYLGVDYGSKKTGIAISDKEAKMSFPKIVVPTKELESYLDMYVQKEHIDAFVIGYSTDQEGNKNDILFKAEAFGEALRLTYNKEVFFEKEFFTSVFARQLERGKHERTARKVKQKEIGNVDAHAAAIMLQRFLDKKNKNSQ